MKLCKSCGKDKSKSDFGARSASVDGLAAKCKLCQKEYDKKRLKDPKRMKARREYQKTPKGKLAHNKAANNWVERNVIKRSAHIMVGNALKGGRLTKMPCEVCGELNSHGHHDDYSKQLDVRWLCDFHHNEWHRENGEGLNAH
jgi:hypothetical protein